MPRINSIDDPHYEGPDLVEQESIVREVLRTLDLYIDVDRLHFFERLRQKFCFSCGSKLFQCHCPKKA